MLENSIGEITEIYNRMHEHVSRKLSDKRKWPYSRRRSAVHALVHKCYLF
jgi:hypothetical protein